MGGGELAELAEQTGDWHAFCPYLKPSGTAYSKYFDSCKLLGGCGEILVTKSNDAPQSPKIIYEHRRSPTDQDKGAPQTNPGQR